jgi:hypothetical protein
MTDLIDRYLAAIARRLPPARAADITAEIGDDLNSRVEAREEMLGRPLTTDEMSALIKEVGHPIAVAARYRGNQWLIGPDVFPFYLAALRVIAALVVLAVAVAGAAHVAFDHQPLLAGILETFAGIWTSLLSTLAVVTIVFAVFERTGVLREHLAKWQPKELPAVETRRPNPWESALEIGGGLLLILWWLGVLPFPLFYSNAPGLVLTPAPIWAALWTPILIVLVAQLVNNLLRWAPPRWASARIMLGVATAIGAVVLAILIYQAGSWVNVTPSGASPQDAADLSNTINMAIRFGLLAAAVIWGLKGAKALWRLARRRGAFDPAPA